MTRPLVLVCGSRSWTDETKMRLRLRELPQAATVLHGGARGADRMAGVIAHSLGLNVVEMRANWARGRQAGFDRNLRMLDEKPDLVLAFWDGRSTGTNHTVTQAQLRSIPVELVIVP